MAFHFSTDRLWMDVNRQKPGRIVLGIEFTLVWDFKFSSLSPKMKQWSAGWSKWTFYENTNPTFSMERFAVVLLPPASAVEVIESEPRVCVCVCVCVCACVDIVSIMAKWLSGERTVHEGNAGGKSTLRRFHFMFINKHESMQQQNLSNGVKMGIPRLVAKLKLVHTYCTQLKLALI